MPLCKVWPRNHLRQCPSYPRTLLLGFPLWPIRLSIPLLLIKPLLPHLCGKTLSFPLQTSLILTKFCLYQGFRMKLMTKLHVIPLLSLEMNPLSKILFPENFSPLDLLLTLVPQSQLQSLTKRIRRQSPISYQPDRKMTCKSLSAPLARLHLFQLPTDFGDAFRICQNTKYLLLRLLLYPPLASLAPSSAWRKPKPRVKCWYRQAPVRMNLCILGPIKAKRAQATIEEQNRESEGIVFRVKFPKDGEKSLKGTKAYNNLIAVFVANAN
jgi:hypothetical protein